MAAKRDQDKHEPTCPWGGGVYSTATKDDSCSPSIFQPYPSYRRCSDDKPEVDGACRGASKNSLKTLLEVGAA